jgi:transposase
MARKNYTDEFRRQAVDLYRCTPGATLRGIAADLGISRHTLNDWVRALDPATASMTTDGARGTQAGSSRPGRASGRGRGRGRGRGLPPQDELVALRARVAALEGEKTTLETEKVKLETERDILRQAAKYFAGETIW